MKWMMLVILPIAAEAQQISPAQQAAQTVARAAGEDFGQGSLSELRARFTPELQQSIGPVYLFLAQRAKLAGRGSYTGTKDTSCFPFDQSQKLNPLGEYWRCSVTMNFSDQTDTVYFTFDLSGRIAAFMDFGIQGPVPFTFSPWLQWSPYWIPFALMVAIGLWHHFRPIVPLTDEVLRRRYRGMNAVAGLGTFALVLLGIFGRVRAINLLAPVVQTFGPYMLLTILLSRGKRPMEEPPIRVAELRPIGPLPRYIWPLLALPAAILAGAAWYAETHWNQLPEPRTFQFVFGPLVMCGSFLLSWYAHTFLVVSGARRNPASQNVFRRYVAMMLLGQIPIAVSAALFAAFGFDNPWLFAALIVVELLGLMAAMIPMAKLRKLPDTSDAMPDGDWRAGLFYWNASDPAWIVRRGPGFTPNFGHPWVAVLVIVLVAQMAAVWFISLAA